LTNHSVDLFVSDSPMIWYLAGRYDSKGLRLADGSQRGKFGLGCATDGRRSPRRGQRVFTKDPGEWRAQAHPGAMDAGLSMSRSHPPKADHEELTHDVLRVVTPGWNFDVEFFRQTRKITA
jgi:hypothetical protein